MDKQLYLKPNVVFEPLADKWYAWSNLISPATAATNIVRHHLKIIESYLPVPSIHANDYKRAAIQLLVQTGAERWCEFIGSIRYTDESNPIVQSSKLVELCTARGMIVERLYGEKELLYEKEPSVSST